MSNRLRAIFLFSTIVAVMLVSAVGTTSVYADDGTPPPPPTETSEVDPSTTTGGDVVTEPPAEVVPPAVEEQPVATEPVVAEPVVAEPVATEPAVTEEAAPAEAAPVVEEEQPAEPQAEAASLLEQVPDDTTVTVLNAEGEAQPLSSQESADIIVTGDPIWCPQYQDPTPGQNGCTESFSDFDGLLAFLQTNDGNPAYQQSGTIYVQAGAYTGSEPSINFNSYSLQNIKNYDLTLQGGWDTTGIDIDPANPTQFNVPILIGTSTNPWAGSLTFNNISISGVSNQTGLVVYSQLDVTLGGVEVTSSQGGADLNAGGSVIVQGSKFNNNKKFGAKVDAGGFVYITNSEFNNNAYSKDKEDGFGLQVNSDDEVYLNTVYANSNEKFGADITAASSVVAVNSFFSGNVSYTHNCYKSCTTCKETANGGYGLKIVTTGSAYLDGVTAEKNFLFGAHAEVRDAEIYNSSFSNNGSGSENNPTGYGLEVISTAEATANPHSSDTYEVTLKNVTANNNQLFGTNIQAKGDIGINNGFFDGNKSYYNSCTSPKKTCYECTNTYYGYGLQVATTGNIDLSTVSASNNYLYGAHLKGANVGISGGTFSNNGSEAHSGEGLQVESTGNVNLSQVEANKNQAFGANILAAGNVNITLSTFNGQLTYTYSGDCTDQDKKGCTAPQPCVKTPSGGGYGLQVIATGTASLVNLSGVTASDNWLYGMHLVAAHVQISGNERGGVPVYTSAQHNKEGVKIESTGSVSIDMLDASDNQLFGATILSGLDTTLDGTVQISNSFFSGNASYISSYCKGKTYSGYGLRVVTTGDDISLGNVKANDNYLYGAYLEGASIDVYGGSTFNSNGTDNRSDHIGKGLEIVSTGQFETVSLTNVEASYNQLFGANITADGSVSVNNGLFIGNTSYTSNCTRSTNTSASTGQRTCSGGQTCTKTYDGYGLRIVTTSDIYLGNVTADKNYLYGAHLEGANVTVQDSTFNSNASPTEQGKTPTGRGLEVKSTGNTSLSGVEANNNQLFGATIEAGGQVSIDSSLFNTNKYSISTSCQGTKGAGYGLKVVSTATTIDPNFAAAGITLTSVQASGNGAEGAILNGQSTVNVTDSAFNNNGASGLDVTVTANNDVTLTNITTDKNKVDGVDVKGACANTVKVENGIFTNNGKYGIKIVDATYAPTGTQTFSGNGSGNVFQNSNACVSSGTGNTSGGNTSGGNTSGGNHGDSHGSNWYGWWLFWYQHRYGHH